MRHLNLRAYFIYRHDLAKSASRFPGFAPEVQKEYEWLAYTFYMKSIRVASAGPIGKLPGAKA